MTAPEANLARRLIKKYKLLPPVDVRALLEEYAQVTLVPFPLDDVDGVSIDIKVPGKRPRVIVNSAQPVTRQKFTMAHELGHVLIPWHVGTIVDQLDPAIGELNDYWDMEREANRFAAELLLPKDWIQALIRDESDLAKVHAHLCRKAAVSAHAAGIRLAELIPGHHVYCIEQDGLVILSGRTEGTFASPPSCDAALPKSAYSYARKHYKSVHAGRDIHWWHLPDAMEISGTDDRAWREILDDIAKELGYRASAAAQFKNQINAVVGYANGASKRLPDYGVATVVGAAMQRLRDRYKGQFEDFVTHRDFPIYIRKRAEELVSKTKS